MKTLKNPPIWVFNIAGGLLLPSGILVGDFLGGVMAATSIFVGLLVPIGKYQVKQYEKKQERFQQLIKAMLSIKENIHDTNLQS